MEKLTEEQKEVLKEFLCYLNKIGVLDRPLKFSFLEDFIKSTEPKPERKKLVVEVGYDVIGDLEDDYSNVTLGNISNAVCRYFVEDRNISVKEIKLIDKAGLIEKVKELRLYVISKDDIINLINSHDFACEGKWSDKDVIRFIDYWVKSENYGYSDVFVCFKDWVKQNSK